MSDQEHYGVRGIALLWFPIVGPIAAWAVHIVYLASIVRFTCTEPTATWTIHAVTAATVAVAVLGTYLAWRLTRVAADEAGPGVAGRHLFLGRLGLIVGVVNVAVILLEELYVVGLHSVRCA
jgi:hypothetical protein